MGKLGDSLCNHPNWLLLPFRLELFLAAWFKASKLTSRYDTGRTFASSHNPAPIRCSSGIHSAAFSGTPQHEAFPNKEMGLATFAPPNRRRNRNASILLFSQRPPGRLLLQERQLNNLAATTWTLKRREPWNSLAYRIQRISFQSCRQFINIDNLQLASRNPTSADKAQAKIPEISHCGPEREGRPIRGSQSPIPTSFSRWPRDPSSGSR